ncbi:ATP-binding protein [Bdellovibrionota bacterium FG-1]
MHPLLRIAAPLTGEVEPTLQWIEVASFLQIPSFHIIGLPAPEVAEARERIRAAIEASGLPVPRKRVIVNLSPAAIRKRGTGADLAMALGILDAHSKRKKTSSFDVIVAWGELGLNGTIKPAGQLTRAVFAAWKARANALIVAQDEAPKTAERVAWITEAGLIPDALPPLVFGASTLSEAWEILKDPTLFVPVAIPPCPKSLDRPSSAEPPSLLPLSPLMERVIGTGAAGEHHLLLLGPRGVGKSHALEWLIALQPLADPKLRIQHALLRELSIKTDPLKPADFYVPIRRIGAQVRPSALTGGAGVGGIRPGEFSLAHGGLLIADEFLEWARDSREALREPLERGVLTLTRSMKSAELPAKFVLAANGNLCPCGGWPKEFPLPSSTSSAVLSAPAVCRCTATAKATYLSRVSGPILDRIDLVVWVAQGEGGAASQLLPLRQRVAQARTLARDHWGKPAGQLSATELETLLETHAEWKDSLRSLKLSSYRARHKILRVALTLAAWDGLSNPKHSHFFEAFCYRMERYGWGK